MIIFVIGVLVVVVLAIIALGSENGENLKSNNYGLKFKTLYRSEDSRYLGFYDEEKRKIIWIKRNHTSLSSRPEYIDEWYSVGGFGIGVSLKHAINSFTSITQVYEHNQRELDNYKRSTINFEEREKRMKELHKLY